MKIEKKILMLLEMEKLYGGNFTYVRNKISNLLGVKNKEVDKCLSTLIKEKEIKIEDNKVLKYVKYENNFSNSKKVLDTTQKVIGTIIENNGVVAVKVRGFGERICSVNQNDLVKNSVGKTCLVKIMSNMGDSLFGNVEDVFGFSDDPIAENVAIASKYGFTNKFSDEKLKIFEKKLNRTFNYDEISHSNHFRGNKGVND